MTSRKSLHSPRRICIALLIGVAVGAAGVSAVGLDLAPSSASAPSHLALPSPRAGDSGQYTYNSYEATDGQLQHVLGPELALTFTWVGPAEAHDATGRPHAVNLYADRYAQRNCIGLNCSYNIGDWQEERSSIVTRDTRRVIGTGSPTGQAVDEPDNIQGLPGVEQRTVGDLGLFGQRFHADPEPAAGLTCGALMPLHGQRVRLDGAIRLWEECSLPEVTGDRAKEVPFDRAAFEQVTWVDADHPFRAVGVAILGDWETVVFDENGGSNLRVWLTEALPYPVRFSWAAFGLQHVFDLTAFTPGEGAAIQWGESGEVSLAPAASVEVAQRTPWGLDETGFEHSFSAAAAWNVALTQDEERALQTYLDQYPDAVVFALRGETYARSYATNSAPMITWYFSLSDGEHQLEVAVSRGPTDTGDVESLDAALRYAQGENTTHIGSWDVDLPYDGFQPSHLPDLLPTARSLAARSGDLLRQPTFSPPFPGFFMTCGHHWEDEPCPGELTLLTRWNWEIEGSLDAATSPGRVQQEILVGQAQTFLTQDGRADRVEWSSLTATDGIGPAPLPVVPEPANEEAIDPVAPGPNWSLPSARALAGLGFLGLLAAAAYYLSPLLKGGMPLFSRLDDGRLLEHPRRKLLVEAIEANPGIHAKELSRLTGMGWGSLQHHLGLLVKAGRLAARPAGGYTSYFLGRKGEAEPMTFVHSAGGRALLAAIRSNPGLSLSQAARSLGLSASTVHYHARQLADAGLIVRERAGSEVRMHPAAVAA